MGEEFEPRKSLMSRYASSIILDEKRKKELEEFDKLKIKMINDRLNKGYTEEQAINEVLRCLYIDGFSGPTFKD